MPYRKNYERSRPQQDALWDKAFRPVGQNTTALADPRAIERISGIPAGRQVAASCWPRETSRSPNLQLSNGAAIAAQREATTPAGQKPKDTVGPSQQQRQQEQRPKEARFMAPVTAGTWRDSRASRSRGSNDGSGNAQPIQEPVKPGRPGNVYIPGSTWFNGKTLARQVQQTTGGMQKAVGGAKESQRARGPAAESSRDFNKGRAPGY
ncbi:hypothetical protein BC834DRAFT_333581 [Gloeopeniophorella convolvens]|nr:hypothetical protein BC834DRAFT_333581 [Gloeopeniophorella convolvens]